MSDQSIPIRTPGIKEKRQSRPDSIEKARSTKKHTHDVSSLMRSRQEFFGQTNESDRSATMTGSAASDVANENSFTSMEDHEGSIEDIDQMQTASNVFSMSKLVENFSLLFNAAIASPNYTDEMRNVFKPMFKQLATELNTELKTEIATNMRNEVAILKAELKVEIASNIKDEFKNITEQMAEQKEQVDNIRKEITELKNGNQDTETDFRYIFHSLQQHEKFLESLDYEKRKCNIIALGIPEENPLISENVTAINDAEKVAMVLSKLKKSEVEIASITRLGDKITQRNGQSPRSRPIKIALKFAEDRKTVLDVSKSLKDYETTNKPLSKIFLKKDTHPAIRREMNRIRDVVRIERSKPENYGHNVWYDWNSRDIKVDDRVIDTYKPNFF